MRTEISWLIYHLVLAKCLGLLFCGEYICFTTCTLVSCVIKPL